MTRHLGDFDTSTVVYGKFTTSRPSTGAPHTLGGTPALSVYKDNSTTQSTTGVTLTADFDSVTGLNHFAIDTSADGTFYSSGSFFDVVITTGTVDSVSAVGVVVGSFTLRKTSALKPTTAGRTLDVSTGGEAGLDWANIGSPTTTVGLSGTTIDAAGIRTAVGLASANLDTQLTTIDDFLDTEIAAIKAKTDLIPASPAAVGDIPTANQNADALLDRANAVETGWTPRQILRILGAFIGGKLSGGGTSTETIRSITDGKDRITATVDASGNRTAITLDAT